MLFLPLSYLIVLLVLRLNYNVVDIKEICNAFLWVYAISSTIIIFILCLSFLGDQNKILEMAPTCATNNIGQSCFLCGSTRAFLYMGNLDFNNSKSQNLFATFLFLLFVVNSIFFIFNIFKSIKLKFYT